ncbi:1,2-phenylacetyl-CoA epoxidase subunit PaaD, partial [Streptomyces anthocyanicus]
MVTATALEEELRRLAGSVLDPELPVLTLDELGVVRAVHVKGADSVEVELTPTYTGCPAVEAMSTDIERVLHERGIRDVSVRTVLSPAWSTDDISDEGRRKLREFGIAPPRGDRPAGPVTLSLGATRTA